MDVRHSTSPSIRRKAAAQADLAEVVHEAVRAEALEGLVVEARGLVLRVLPVPAEVPAGPGLVAGATRPRLPVEEALRPFPA